MTRTFTLTLNCPQRPGIVHAVSAILFQQGCDHQAYDRGVKLVGATAHYVTPDLDEGPIIEQEVIRIDHTFDPRNLATVGRDAEALALSRAVRWHCERRVLLNDRSTVVFRRRLAEESRPAGGTMPTVSDESRSQARRDCRCWGRLSVRPTQLTMVGRQGTCLGGTTGADDP